MRVSHRTTEYLEGLCCMVGCLFHLVDKTRSILRLHANVHKLLFHVLKYAQLSESGVHFGLKRSVFRTAQIVILINGLRHQVHRTTGRGDSATVVTGDKPGHCSIKLSRSRWRDKLGFPRIEFLHRDEFAIYKLIAMTAQNFLCTVGYFRIVLYKPLGQNT